MTEMERVARRDILMQHARALRDYCDHKKDEAGLYRTFRWAEEVDLE